MGRYSGMDRSQASQNLSQMQMSPHMSVSQLNAKKKRKGKLLRRSHHTMNTIFQKSEKLRNGYKMNYYISYIFGGLIQESDGRFSPTNDLIEVVTKKVLLDENQANEVEKPIQPSIVITREDEAQFTLVRDQGGVRPMPRRDHQAILITKNKYLLIYGGKNDNAFSYTLNLHQQDMSPDL